MAAEGPRPTPLSHLSLLSNKPLATVDIFVDDYIGLGQNHVSNPLQNQRRVLFRRIDQMFRPNQPTDSTYRKEPISETKRTKEMGHGRLPTAFWVGTSTLLPTLCTWHLTALQKLSPLLNPFWFASGPPSTTGKCSWDNFGVCKLVCRAVKVNFPCFKQVWWQQPTITSV